MTSTGRAGGPPAQVPAMLRAGTGLAALSGVPVTAVAALLAWPLGALGAAIGAALVAASGATTLVVLLAARRLDATTQVGLVMALHGGKLVLLLAALPAAAAVDPQVRWWAAVAAFVAVTAWLAGLVLVLTRSPAPLLQAPDGGGQARDQPC